MRKILRCEVCGKRYEMTHKRSVDEYPKTAETVLEDPLTKGSIYAGYMWNTTDPAIIRCFSKGHSIRLAEVNELGKIRFLFEKED